jgi:hypothetical protein
VLEKLKIKLLSYSLFVVVPGPLSNNEIRIKKRRAEKIKQQQKALKEKKKQWIIRITQKI